MSNNIKDKSIVELKSICFDMLQDRDNINNNLQTIYKEINERLQNENKKSDGINASIKNDIKQSS